MNMKNYNALVSWVARKIVVIIIIIVKKKCNNTIATVSIRTRVI